MINKRWEEIEIEESVCEIERRGSLVMSISASLFQAQRRLYGFIVFWNRLVQASRRSGPCAWEFFHQCSTAFESVRISFPTRVPRKMSGEAEREKGREGVEVQRERERGTERDRGKKEQVVQ